MLCHKQLVVSYLDSKDGTAIQLQAGQNIAVVTFFSTRQHSKWLTIIEITHTQKQNIVITEIFWPRKGRTLERVQVKIPQAVYGSALQWQTERRTGPLFQALTKCIGGKKARTQGTTVNTTSIIIVSSTLGPDSCREKS